MTRIDDRFERDLREILGDMAPDDAPAALRDAVMGVPSSSARHRLHLGWPGRTYALLAATAALTVLVVIAGTGFLRLPGVDRGFGGPAASGSPAPSASGALGLQYQVMPADGVEPTPNDVAAVAAVITKRLDATGIVAPSVTTTPSGRIVVELAVDRSDEATVTALRQLIGTTGRIDLVPLGTTPVEAGQPVDLGQHPPLLSGDQVASATISQDQTGLRTVGLTLDPAAAALFAAYTRDHVGEFFAIVEDGVALTVPMIQAAIEGGEMQITGAGPGGYPLAEAQALVAIIRSGPLPFPVREVAAKCPESALVEQHLDRGRIRHARGEREAEQDPGLPRLEVVRGDPAARGQRRDPRHASGPHAGRLAHDDARGRGPLERLDLARGRVAGARPGAHDPPGAGGDRGIDQRPVRALVADDHVHARQAPAGRPRRTRRAAPSRARGDGPGPRGRRRPPGRAARRTRPRTRPCAACSPS